MSLFVDMGGGSFGLWNGKPYGERNLQMTGANGLFAFIVPPGKYKLFLRNPGMRHVRHWRFLLVMKMLLSVHIRCCVYRHR